MDDHHIIDIENYNLQPSSSVNTFCSHHTSEPFTIMGCRQCGQALCVQCIDDQQGCQGQYLPQSSS